MLTLELNSSDDIQLQQLHVDSCVKSWEASECGWPHHGVLCGHIRSEP